MTEEEYENIKDLENVGLQVQADIARQLTIQNKLRESALTIEREKVGYLERIAKTLNVNSQFRKAIIDIQADIARQLTRIATALEDRPIIITGETIDAVGKDLTMENK